MKKNILFHFNFKLKIEWHFRFTDSTDYVNQRIKKRCLTQISIFLNKPIIKNGIDTFIHQPRIVEEMFKRKLTKNQGQLKILVPYLNNLSEAAIFGINKSRKEHKIVTLQNEEVKKLCSKTLKYLINPKTAGQVKKLWIFVN